ncbi:hypothetical protein [Paenibacillus antarcticus]|uniref:Uncharacterized protein n=1 Tax=Paenibacillus antarcticus TaxID=253703 RepID=A0A168J5T9_9BACL|nr:hypothetical protein [Paenibacillus antarcticus]OAB40192.1 hypothetical protein PBAT_23025 [Paenibacillus antarcticus]OAB47742.1 hypothetical protein PBAT_04655 [Paenibacillus antarcticus]
MEKFKATIQLRIKLLAIVMVITVLSNVILQFMRDRLPARPDFIFGFQTGVFIGLLVFLLYIISKYTACLKNAEALKKLYIKEHDEREQLIAYKASVLALVVLLVIVALSTVIAGFFNIIVFITLLSVMGLLLIVMLTTLTYYRRAL